MARILIRNAHVITLDEQGDLPCADILVDGDRIEAIWTRETPYSATTSGAARGHPVGVDGQFDPQSPRVDEVVDAHGFIAIPGLVNAHMHTWQTALRGVAANWTLLEYFKNMHAGLATVFQPEDLHIATLVGALNQLNCGTTTLADWCHNNKTPAHNDAAIEGLLQSGIRAAFFHGTPKPDPKPGETPFWEQPHPRSELERLLRTHHGKSLLSVHAAVLGPHYAVMDVALHDFRMAKELGVVASMHQGGGPARTPDGWQRLEQEGLLGPHINIVHGHALSDEQLKRFCGLGMSFSAAAESEMSQGHGHPITGRLLALGKAPSLGVDLESNCSGDLLTQARIALGIQRSLDNVEHRALHGGIPTTSTVTTRQALEWVTVEGARMLGQLDRIGTLKVGKQADVVFIRASDLNMQPVHDAVNSVVFQTSIGNITDVLVAGRWKKRAGRLLDDNGQALDLGPLLERLNASGRKIVQALAL